MLLSPIVLNFSAFIWVMLLVVVPVPVFESLLLLLQPNNSAVHISDAVNFVYLDFLFFMVCSFMKT
jgi:hypothetical protein